MAGNIYERGEEYRRNALTEKRECFKKLITAPIEVKEAAKELGLCVQDYIWLAIEEKLKKQRENENTNEANGSDCRNSN